MSGKTTRGRPKKVLNSKPYVEKGSVEEQRQLYELQRELMMADEDAVEFIAKNFSTKKKKDTKKDIDMFTKMYYQRCLMKIAGPLSNGLSVDSVMQSVGMYAGMCLFSKDFRQNCHDIVRDTVYPYVEKKANEAGPGSVWWDRKNRMLMDREGRLPLDSKTVAIMDLGLCRGCYNKMREPGADVDAVQKEYTEAFKVLYEQAKADGVNPDDIKHDAHVIVGKFMEHDLSVAQFFEGTGDFSVVRDDYRTVQNQDGTTSQVWDGEFKNKNGTAYTNMFIPRAPYGMSTFRSMMSDMLDESFTNCPTFNDLEKAYKDPKFAQKRNIIFSMMRSDGFDDETIKQSATEVMQDRFQAWADSHSGAVKDETGKRVSEKENGSSKGKDVPENEHADTVSKKPETLPGPIAQKLVDLDKEIYVKMRPPCSKTRSDGEIEFARYSDAMLKEFFRLKDAGYTSEQIFQSQQELIADEIKKNPASANIWGETANGVTIWDEQSKFMMKNGKEYKSVLMPRLPFREKDAETAMANMVDEYVANCATASDFKKALEDPEYVQRNGNLVSMLKADGFSDKRITSMRDAVIQERQIAWMAKTFGSNTGKSKRMPGRGKSKPDVSLENMWKKHVELGLNAPSGGNQPSSKVRHYDDADLNPEVPGEPQLS